MVAEPQVAPGSGPKEGGKYERILRGALEVFARKGFHEAKIAEIARTAGVADGTIYLYFKNKDDLLCSLFETTLEKINTDLRVELAQIDGTLDKIEHFVRYHLRLAQHSVALAVFITIEIRLNAKFMREYAKAPLAEYLNQLGDLIDRGKAEGVLRPEISTTVLKHAIFGALDQACHIWIINPNRQAEDLDEVGRQLTDFFLRAARRES